MIESFGDKATESLWKTGKSGKGFPPDIRQRALDMLQMLNAATNPDDLRFPPGNRLEQLSGDLASFWSIRINKQWRIIFRFAGENAHGVAIVDYH